MQHETQVQLLKSVMQLELFLSLVFQNFPKACVLTLTVGLGSSWALLQSSPTCLLFILTSWGSLQTCPPVRLMSQTSHRSVRCYEHSVWWGCKHTKCVHACCALPPPSFLHCRTWMWILKRWTERPQRRRAFTFYPAACHSTVSTPESALCRGSRWKLNNRLWLRTALDFLSYCFHPDQNWSPKYFWSFTAKQRIWDKKFPV